MIILSFLIIAVFVLLLFLGLGGFIVGLIGVIIASSRKKRGEPCPTSVLVAFSVVLVVGMSMAAISTGFFSHVVWLNTMPPDSYVETDIVIEENGYQDTRFTADGVVYEVLDFEVYEVGDPVFSYQTEGFWNASQCGNYYVVENEQGFDLVTDGCGLLFCPIDQKDAVVAYYTDTANLVAYYEDWDREFKLLDEEYKNALKVLELDTDALPLTRITMDEANTFEIEFVCQDGVVVVANFSFLVLDGGLYYVHSFDFAEYSDDGIVYMLGELPSDIQEDLLSIYNC